MLLAVLGNRDGESISNLSGAEGAEFDLVFTSKPRDYIEPAQSAITWETKALVFSSRANMPLWRTLVE